MALIKCENCGKEISSTMNKCPHCGYERKETPVKADRVIMDAFL